MTIYDAIAIVLVLVSLISGGTLWVYVARWWAARKYRNMTPEQRAFTAKQAMEIVRWHEKHKEENR